MNRAHTYRFPNGPRHLSGKLRLYLAHLMVSEDPLVSVGRWEASVSGRWPDFPQVAEELQRTLVEAYAVWIDENMKIYEE